MNNAFRHAKKMPVRANFERDSAIPALVRTISAEHTAAAKQTSIEIQKCAVHVEAQSPNNANADLTSQPWCLSKQTRPCE